MNLRPLIRELQTGHPDTGPYSADAQTAANEINAVNRTRNVERLSGEDLFAATNGAEFAALTEHRQLAWLTFCNRDSVDPFHPVIVAFVQWVFGGGSATISTLSALRVESISRAQEIGYSRPIDAQQIRYVRGENG